MNSRGLFRYYLETMAQFSITAMAGDSSGWAKATSATTTTLNPAALARTGGAQGGAIAQPARDCRRDATP